MARGSQPEARLKPWRKRRVKERRKRGEYIISLTMERMSMGVMGPDIVVGAGGVKLEGMR